MPGSSHSACARCASEHLRASAERTGIQHTILMVDGSGDRDTTQATIARLGAEVLPRLRE